MLYAPINKRRIASMNTYCCLYRAKQLIIKSDTTYNAQLEAAKQLGVPDKKRYQISVMLISKPDGSEVVHSTASIG